MDQQSFEVDMSNLDKFYKISNTNHKIFKALKLYIALNPFLPLNPSLTKPKIDQFIKYFKSNN